MRNRRKNDIITTSLHSVPGRNKNNNKNKKNERRGGGGEDDEDGK